MPPGRRVAARRARNSVAFGYYYFEFIATSVKERARAQPASERTSVLGLHRSLAHAPGFRSRRFVYAISDELRDFRMYG